MKLPHRPWIALILIGSSLAQAPPPDQGGPGGDERRRSRGEGPDQRPDQRPGGEGQRGPGGPGMERPGMREMFEAWRKADSDGDGTISLTEFGAMERIGQLPDEKRTEIFNRFDKNGDGKISKEELPQRPQEGMPPLAQVDANKDGRIVFEEFRNLSFVTRLPEDRQRMMFDRMDQDKDGALTPKDRPQGGPGRDGGPSRDGRPFRDMKRDGDGKGGGHGPNGPELIKVLDRNADSALDFEEFRQAGFLKDKSEDEQEDRFEEMDRNDDLKIDAADFPPPGGHKPQPAEPEKGP